MSQASRPNISIGSNVLVLDRSRKCTADSAAIT